MQNDYRYLDIWAKMVKIVIQFPNTDDTTYHKRNLVTSIAEYMDETSKPKYSDNKLVAETRALILEMEKAGEFVIASESHVGPVTLSKAHKFCFHLITSKEIGYKDVFMEVPILKGITYADIYIKEIDLVIMIQGPVHFFSDQPNIMIPKLIDRFLQRNVDVLYVDHKFFEEFVEFGPTLITVPEIRFAEIKQRLKKMIDDRLKLREQKQT